MSAPTLDDQIRAHLEMLEAAPGDLQAFEALEALYESASRWEDLIALYEGRARVLHGPGAPLLAKAANLAHTKLRNVARAEELYRQLLRSDPAHRDALRSMVDLFEEREDWPALAAALEREAGATKDARETARTTLRLAKLQEEKLGRRDRAALLYARACRLDPSLDEARVRALACFTALRRYAQAKRMLDAARDAGADRKSLAAEYARLGTALLDEPLAHDLAMDALIEATALDRGAPGAAQARERLKAFPRAWRDEVRALEEAAGRATDRREAARLQLRLAQLHAAYDPDGVARALARIERSWALAPGDSFALDLLARVYAEKGDHRGHADALARLAAVTRDRAALVRLHVEMAQLDLVRFGDAESALAALARALDLDPACESAAHQAFELHVDAGRFAEALSVLERHLAAAPEKAVHGPLRVRAAQLAKERLADPARARRHLEAALRADPGDGAAATALAPLLADAGEWARLAGVLELSASFPQDPQERVRLLERLAEVQQERLGKPRDALRTLARALAADPARGATRKAMEGAAARADAFLELARAYRSAAAEVRGDLKTKKTLLRRVAEIFDRDLANPEEAVGAWKALAAVDPEDRGAAAALEACMARAGRQEELANELEARRARASGDERRVLTAKLAHLWHDAARFDRAAALWREALRDAPEDDEAIWGLHAALEASEGPRAAEERVEILAALAKRAKSAPERAALDLARAEALIEPLGRLADAAALTLTVLHEGGLVPSQRAEAAAMLERLVDRGVEPLRIAQALAPVYAGANDAPRHAAMLEMIARSLPRGADPRERARHLLDASALREKLGDARGALSAAANALRACPEHADARRRCEALAREVGAHRELLALLCDAARRLEGRPEDEVALRLRAAAVAEEDLGAFDDATEQLRRALALRPGDVTILAALTRAALASERWAEAADLLAERAAAAQGAERVALLAQRAEVLAERLRDAAGAAGALRDALSGAAPEQRPRLLQRLADALGMSGDAAGRAAALAELAQASRDPAEASRAALEAARIDAGLGDGRAAAEQLAAALAANPGDAAALAALEEQLDAQDPQAVLAAAAALAPQPDPRRRIRALEAEARVRPDPAARAAARRAAARIYEEELRQPSLAFAATAEAVRAQPADAEGRRELRRLAVETQEVEGCGRLYDELCEHAGDGLRAALLRERADFAERRLDPERAADAWARALEAAPGDRDALAALRRLHRARERWGELAETCAELARRAGDAAQRADALREEAAVAEVRLADPARAAAAWAEVARLAPDDPEPAAALERLYGRLDRPADLAPILEGRLARAFDLETAAQLAELRRERLGDAAGALALHTEILRRDPRRAGSREGLAAIAAVPGAVGREALETADVALRAAGEHAKRVAARETRLRSIEDPGERARLLAEIRTVLEEDLGEPQMAFIAACRAFVEGGPARAGVEEDLVRLARETGSEEELCAVLEQAAATAAPDEALALLRRAARARGERGGPEAIAAWNAVLAAAPEDAEALETLERLYAAARSAAEILDMARRRAALAADPEKLALLLEAARLAEEVGDPACALDALRDARSADPAALEPLLGLERLLSRGEPGPELLDVLGTLASAASGDPAHRVELLLRRAALLEAGPDARAAIEGYAEVLAESPREPGAVAGLDRLLVRPEAAADAARVLEDVHRASGDARKLAALLETRVATADASERAPLLAEIAALHERLGDRPEAFRAKLRELHDAVARGEDAPGARVDLERLAAATGAWNDLARAFEEALAAGKLPRPAALDVRRRLAVVSAERLGRLDQAARWFEEVARETPSAETLGALARVYRKMGAPRDLARTLERLADVAPAAAARKELLLEVAKIMAEQLADREGAVAAYKKILAVDPEDPNALRLLGGLLGGAEKWDELVAVLSREVSVADRQPNLVPEAAELRFRLGRIRHQRLADAEGALACYREVLSKVPRHPAALAALEELARGTGAAAVQAALVLEPIYSAEGEHQKVIDALEARTANETDPAARATLLRRIAEIYGGPLRNAEMAFLAAGRALAADPDATATLSLVGTYAAAAGLADEHAALLAENADRAREPAARAEYQRRIARLVKSDAPRAAEAWQRVLDLVPEDREATLGLVEALRGGADPDALAQAIRRSLAGEEDPELRVRLLGDLAALQDERLGDVQGAIVTSKRLLELAPKDRAAFARLDRLCAKTERWVDLAEVLAHEAALATEENDAAALVPFQVRLAELKETRLLDREGALALYEQVLQTRPDHPEAIARLEALLQKDSTNERAAVALEGAYGAQGDAQRQAAVLEVRAGERPDALERKALYVALAELREKLGQPELAFLALCKAFRDDPADRALRERMVALAEKSGHEEELAAIFEDELDRLPPGETAEVALRLGELYENLLGDPAKAAGFLRKAVALDPGAAQAALPALERLYARLEGWAELADVVSQRASQATGAERVQRLFRLGQICEERLASPDRAAEAYEGALQGDPRHTGSLRALEALYEAAGRREDLLENLRAQRAAGADPATKERILARMAALAAELGRLDESVALWKELLTVKPRHEEALAALEDLYERVERWSDLAQHLRVRAQSTVDRREIARLNDKLGQVLGTRLGDPSQAIQSYKAVLDTEPRNRRALEALRDIHAAQGDAEALAGIYRRLVPLQEDAAGVKRTRLELAEVLLRAGNKRDAIEQGKLAFDIEPHQTDELVRIEEIFRQAGAAQEGVRAAEARAALLAAQGGPAEAVPAWLAIAELWKGQKRPDAAAAALEKVIELDPANRTAYEELRQLHANAGNWRAFARACDVFAPHLADPAEKLALLKEVAGVHEKKLGQKEMAFLSWCRALAEAPGDAEALAAAERLAAETEAIDELTAVLEQVADEARGMVKARLLLRLGKLHDEMLDDADGAENVYRRALEADPASPEALEALTQLFKRRGRVRDLVITLEQKLEAAAGLDEKKATLLEVAKLYDGEMKDVEEAVTALRRVLELDGADASALEQLSAIFRREQRWQDLAQVLSRARDLASDETARVAFQLQIAELYENEIGDDEAAVEAYRTVVGLDDRSQEALAGLERLYTKLDRFAELNRVYERQIDLAEDAREKVRILAKSAGIHDEKLHDPRRSIEKNEAILRLDGGNLPALKALERLYRDAHAWDKLIPVMQHHLTLVQDRREQVALEVSIGEVFWKEMSRVDRAEAIFNHALQLDPESREAVSALGRLYERSGNWNLALDMLRREARIAGGGKDAVDVYARIGNIFEEMLQDAAGAKEAYGRALQLDPGHLPTLRALKGIAERERDRDRFLELLIDEARYVPEVEEKTRLYTEVGRVYQEERDDRDQAARYYEEALKRTAGHPETAMPLSDIYVAQARWVDAERVLDGMVELLGQGGEAKELCRQTYRLGYVAQKLGKRDKALACYRRSYELDATYLPALEGLGHLLVEDGQWEEALRIFTTIIVHHRDALTDLEVVETHWQIGEIAEKLGQTERAVGAFRKALEIDGNHEPSRRSLVRVLDATGDHDGAVEQRQRLLPLLEGQAKFEAYVAIGEACRDALKDPYQAIDAFLGASRIDPTALQVTEALLGLYRETRQGQKAADVLAQILRSPEVQADAGRAAKLHLSLGEILRDEVKDEEAAVGELERALDKNPRLVQAFAAIEEILTKAKRWADLEQAYIRMVQRLPKGPEAAQARLALWKTLGELYQNVLKNDDGARMAYQVVAKADPEDAVSIETYAELTAKKPGQEGEAIAAYRQLLRAGAKAQKAASALVTLHAARKEYDLAYSAAQVLAHLLAAATPEELQVVSRLRKFARDQASRTLDDAAWKLLLHERAKGPLAEIMTLLALHARPTFVQKEKDLGLVPKKDEIDVQGSMLFFANMFKYVERTLGFRGLRLFRKGEVPSRLQLVPTEPPGLLADEQMFKERPKKELWFSIGKAMAFARPELFLARLMPHDQLDLVFQAACSVGTSRFVVTADPHLVEKLKRELERTLPENVRKNVLKLLARQYCDVQHPGDVRAFLDGAELTSNRVGTLLAGDLEVARKGILSERPQVSKLREETRVRDLALFCVSEEYGQLREKLGLSCVVPG